MKKYKSGIFALTGLFCLAATVLSLCLGAVKLSAGQLWQALLGGPRDTVGFIFWYLRLPRTAACLLAGAALAASGCILQGVLGNPLASPGILGVNAGAGLTVTLCCAMGMFSGWSLATAAFGGAMAAAFFVMLLSQKTGVSRTTVILAGAAMNSILNALRDAVITLVPEAGLMGNDFRIGSFGSVVSARLWPAAILIVVSLTVTALLCNELDVLSLGEETAQGLGMRVKRMRTVFLLLAAMLAGAAVSFAGLLGFVGLLVPHIARKMVGSQSRSLLWLSILMGAGLVTACDLLSRVLFAPHELPVGIALSVIGGPFFLWLLLKKRGGHKYA